MATVVLLGAIALLWLVAGAAWATTRGSHRTIADQALVPGEPVVQPLRVVGRSPRRHDRAA